MFVCSILKITVSLLVLLVSCTNNVLTSLQLTTIQNITAVFFAIPLAFTHMDLKVARLAKMDPPTLRRGEVRSGGAEIRILVCDGDRERTS
jgi:hypothetical protein